MSYSIKVRPSPETLLDKTSDFFVKHFDSYEKFRSVVALCDSKRSLSIAECLLIPARTNNWSNFCNDFFCPILTNKAFKTNYIALKIIFVMCDICTFPFRLITVIPRFLYNLAHPKEAHLFYQYLIKNGVDAAKLKADHVELEISWEDRLLDFRGEMGIHRNVDTKPLNFIQLPEGEYPAAKKRTRSGGGNKHWQSSSSLIL